MSTISVINVKHPSSASNNLVTDSSGNTTAAGTVAMGSSFLRNRIINGAMVIDQRNGGASVTPASGSNYYSVDRWIQFLSQNSKYSIQQSTTAPAGFTNSVLVTSLSAYTSTSSDVFAFVQYIEGFNVADFGWGTAGAQTITISFWVRSSLTGTFGGALSNSAVNRSYPFTFTINAANTFEYKTITVAGDTTGTWVTNNGIGLRLWFNLGTGSTYLGTAGAWAAADYRGATGETNLLATNGATFYITGVQLEVGTVATPFERRLYGTELALCQRYYWASDTSTNHCGIAGYALAGGNIASSIIYPVAMRASPTVTIGAQTLINTTGLVANSITSLGYLLLISATANGNAQATLNSSRITHSIEL